MGFWAKNPTQILQVWQMYLFSMCILSLLDVLTSTHFGILFTEDAHMRNCDHLLNHSNIYLLASPAAM